MKTCSIRLRLYSKPMLFFLSLLPRKLVSRLTGKLVYAKRPRLFAVFLRDLLIRLLSIDSSEAEKPVGEYPSFGDFFVRRLKGGARPVEDACVTSPCDGRFTEGGIIDGQTMIQAKGLDYTLDDLFEGGPAAKEFENGKYAVIYLAPHNYHRVHAPARGRCFQLDYFPGDLWPVNAPSVAGVPRLFAVNERISALFETEYGKMAMLMVGALNVGRMELTRHPGEFTNDPIRAPKRGSRKLQEPEEYKKGDEFGIFHMGSTVILLFDSRFASAISGGEDKKGRLLCGQSLFNLK